MWREDKENHRQRKLLEKQEKRKQKEKEKKNSKAAKEAEKLVSKQIDKTEVHKYLGVIVDPALVSAPPAARSSTCSRTRRAGRLSTCSSSGWSRCPPRAAWSGGGRSCLTRRIMETWTFR